MGNLCSGGDDSQGRGIVTKSDLDKLHKKPANREDSSKNTLEVPQKKDEEGTTPKSKGPDVSDDNILLKRQSKNNVERVQVQKTEED